MGNAASFLSSCDKCCSCDQSTQFPGTYYEDCLLWDLFWCRYRIQEEEYYKKNGIRCALKCTVSEDQRSAKEGSAPLPPIIKPRHTASDENIERKAIQWCCEQRLEDMSNDELSTEDPCPSYREEYLEAINPMARRAKKRNFRNHLPVKRPCPIKATELERRRFWLKYYPPHSNHYSRSEPPEKLMRTALENSCTCPPAQVQLPTAEQYSDLLQCPNVSAQEYPTWTLCASPQQPDMQCPRLNIVPTPTPYYSQPAGSQNIQVNQLYGQPPTPYGNARFPYATSPEQRNTHTYRPPLQTQQAVIEHRRYFLGSLHVGEAAPINLSVVIFSNNVILAEVKGFSPQASIQVKSTISKRWMIPPGVSVENISCFLGNEKLVIATIPPPAQFYQLLHLPTAQCLGPPRRLAYPYPPM